MEAQEPKRRRGAHFKAAAQDAAREVEESSEVADDVEESAKKAPGSCRPGRGFAGRAYPVKRQEKSLELLHPLSKRPQSSVGAISPMARYISRARAQLLCG